MLSLSLPNELPVTFADLVKTPDALMGVKAVWGRSQEPVMCFGSRGNATLKDKGHFSQAKNTAERSLTQPYFVTIGGGDQVPPELRGRVLEVVRSTGVFGETLAFVQDEQLRKRLAQWPVAVVISEVYTVKGEPRLIEDLGFPDRRILTNAFDTIIRDDAQIERLWDAMRSWALVRNWNVRLPPGFYDPGKVQMFGTRYPKLTTKTTEGTKVWRLSLEAERSAALATAAKDWNRAKNGGVVKCEACLFTDDHAGMFDAHHLDPIATGRRESRPDDFAVLCPTCHRWAHAKAEDKLTPLPVNKIAPSMAAASLKTSTALNQSC
jgi:hypothetical protein